MLILIRGEFMVHLLALVTAVLVAPFTPRVTVFLLIAYVLDEVLWPWER